MVRQICRDHTYISIISILPVQIKDYDLPGWTATEINLPSFPYVSSRYLASAMLPHLLCPYSVHLSSSYLPRPEPVSEGSRTTDLKLTPPLGAVKCPTEEVRMTREGQLGGEERRSGKRSVMRR